MTRKDHDTATNRWVGAKDSILSAAGRRAGQEEYISAAKACAPAPQRWRTRAGGAISKRNNGRHAPRVCQYMRAGLNRGFTRCLPCRDSIFWRSR